MEGPQNERASIINLDYVFQLGEMEHEGKYGTAFITAYDRVTAWWYETKEERDDELARIEKLIGTYVEGQGGATDIYV